MVKCAVPFCKNDSRRQTKKNDNISFHRFPKDHEAAIEWAKIIKMPNWKPNIQSSICSMHFSQSSISESKQGLRKLVRGALPELHLEGQVITVEKKIPAITKMEDGSKDCTSDRKITPKRLKRRILQLNEVAKRRRLRCNALYTQRNRLKKKIVSLKEMLKQFGEKSVIAQAHHSILEKCEASAAELRRIYCKDDKVNLDNNGDQPRFYNDGARKVTTSEQTGTEQTVPKGNVFRAYQCNNCNGIINGFLYKCVECFDYDLCGACEFRGVHPLHYVLRIPQSQQHDKIQLVMETIQHELNLSLSKGRPDVSTVSVKLEIKEEPIHTEVVCVEEISISREDCVDSSDGHKDMLKPGENIAETLHDDVVVETLKDCDKISVPLLSGNNDSYKDAHRKTPQLTRDTNKARRTFTSDQSPDHSENSQRCSDDNNDDNHCHLPKRKRTTLCDRSPKIPTYARPVEASPQLREKEASPQAGGAKKQVYITVMPLSEGVPPKYKLNK